MNFDTSPALWLLAGVLLVALVWALRAWLGFRSVREDARADYAFRQERGMAGAEGPEELYVRAYTRVHGPRAQGYTAAGLVAVVVLTPVLLRLADLVMVGVWQLSGRERTFEPGFLVHQFGIFFLMILGWALIGWLAAWQFHKRRPTDMRDELLRQES